SKTNQTTLNGITFNFNNVTNDTPAYVNISDDTDAAVDKIVKFVDQYNSVVDEVTSKTREERYNDYDPLTSEEMESMSEREIELWEEKARSGLLKSDRILMDGLSKMRQAWMGSVESDGNFKHLSDIGISTTRDYMDGGKLVIDEDKLREALRDDPTSVDSLFTNSSDGADRGIFNKLNDAIDQTTDRINDKAGRSTSQIQQYSLGRELQNMNTRIDNFNRRLVQVEDRYWSQFTAMEKAIQKMNEQSNYMSQQMMGGQQ
ncbi:MAG: flagellar filament capping protein FliD, partial [Bacillota bacterium]